MMSAEIKQLLEVLDLEAIQFKSQSGLWLLLILRSDTKTEIMFIVYL